jgi:hypothetical protein
MTDDDRTTIPTLRAATKDLTQAANNEMSFNPGDMQNRVKARFYRRMDEMSHVVDKETVFDSKKLVVELAGTERILSWLENPSFAAWFVDAEYLSDTIASEQQRSLAAITAVRDGERTSDADVLKAARMLLELGDQFPGKKSEVKFLDDRINDMSDGETDKEIKRLQSQLGNDDEEAK